MQDAHGRSGLLYVLRVAVGVAPGGEELAATAQLPQACAEACVLSVRAAATLHASMPEEQVE
jgi:hypothetical protein